MQWRRDNERISVDCGGSDERRKKIMVEKRSMEVAKQIGREHFEA